MPDSKTDSEKATYRRTLGDARQEATERAVLYGPGDFEATGWTLNVSRGGARLVLFDADVKEGMTCEVLLGEAEKRRPGTIVWVRNEPDGQIVGVEFLDAEGTVPPPPGYTKPAAQDS